MNDQDCGDGEGAAVTPPLPLPGLTFRGMKAVRGKPLGSWGCRHLGSTIKCIANRRTGEPIF